MKNFRLKHWMAMLLLVFLLVGCGGGSGGSDSIDATATNTHGGTGTLWLGLIDTSTEAYDGVYVTIDEVRVHRCDTLGEEACEGTWTTVATPKETYDLLELVNGVIAPLGVAELEPGIYTQMRLYLGSDWDTETHPFPHYVIVKDTGVPHELKVPSGYKSGIKLVHEFEIEANITLDLLLDFDADKSVVKAGKSGKYLLKPTIKILDTLKNATLSGTVTDNQSLGLDGVPVSAQTYDEGSADQKDWISTFTTTYTADGEGYAGQYMMYLPPGDYNIVAYKPEYIPECRPVSVAFGNVLEEDFELAPSELGTISGVVDIEDPGTGQTANLSFRQTCGENQTFEVTSLTEVYGDYSIDLPEGVYDVVSSSDDRKTLVVEGIPIAEGSPVQLNFTLQLPTE